MIYMAGDNNLAVDMAYAMEQIREVAKDGADSLNLFVYYDGNSSEIPTIYCDFSDAKNPKYVRSFMVPDKLYPVPEKYNENAADRRSVLNFVDWCVNKAGRRAKRYGLIFSGHSLGFEDKGLFRDDSSGKSMKIADLFFLIQRIILPKNSLEDLASTDKLKGDELERETKELIGQRLDILGFDSCVMGMLEVGYQFCDVTKTMIASEGSVPSAGWTYAKILGGLARGEHRHKSAQKVAEHFVKEFIDSQDKYTVGGVSVDMAAWDMGRLMGLADALDGLAQVLIDCFEDENSRVYRQMERMVLQAHWKCQSYMWDQNVDLGDLCELLYSECELFRERIGGRRNGDFESSPKSVPECADQSGKNGDPQRVQRRRVPILERHLGLLPMVVERLPRVSEKLRKYMVREGLQEPNFKAKWLGWADFLKLYLSQVALRKAAEVTDEASEGMKYRYFSGIQFDDESSDGLETPEASGPVGSAGSTKLGGSGSSTRLGGSGSSTRMGGSGSSTRLGGSGSSTRLGGSGSSTRRRLGSSTRLGGSGSSNAGGGSSARVRELDADGRLGEFDAPRWFGQLDKAWRLRQFDADGRRRPGCFLQHFAAFQEY